MTGVTENRIKLILASILFPVVAGGLGTFGVRLIDGLHEMNANLGKLSQEVAVLGEKFNSNQIKVQQNTKALEKVKDSLDKGFYDHGLYLQKLKIDISTLQVNFLNLQEKVKKCCD